MGAFILALILIAVGLLMLLRVRLAPKKTPQVTVDPKTGKARPAKLGWLGSSLLAWLLILGGIGIIANRAVYSQDVGASMVLRTPGGTIAGVDTTPGFGITAPWNDPISFNVRNQIITMAGNGEGGEGPAITAQTSDNATASIDITVRYSINPARVGDVYAAYGSQEGLVSRALDVDVRSVVRDIPVKYAASALRQQRSQVALDIQKALSERWEQIGVTVDQVDLRDIRFSDDIENSLAAVQTARSRVESARADLDTAKIRAEQVKTDAQAQSDADQIIRCGAETKQVNEVIGGKEQQVTKIVPIPVEECQNRLNEQVLTSKYIQMLEKAAEAGNTVFVVPPDQQALLTLGTKDAPAPSPTQ